MCGILGFSGKNKIDDIKLKILLMFIGDRGKDGMGIGYYRTDQFFNQKEEKEAKRFVEGLINPETNILVGHSRNASFKSSKKIDNLHPFLEGIYYGVHNGYFYNHLSFGKDVDTDSQKFYRELNNNDGDFKKTISQFSGTAALAYIDTNQNTYLFREGKPLYYGYDENGDIYYASLENYLEAIDLENIQEVPQNTLLIFNDGELVDKVEACYMKKVANNTTTTNNITTTDNKIGTTHLISGRLAPKESTLCVSNSGKLFRFWKTEKTIQVEKISSFSRNQHIVYKINKPRSLMKLKSEYPLIYKKFTSNEL